MRGYLIHHRSNLYDGVRADYYRNDPYVWFSPYLWSFCHLKQNPRVEEGMTVLWCSKASGTFVCDLVMIVAEIIPFHEARNRYAHLDAELAQRQFEQGMLNHPEVQRVGAKTYVADMERSYIPHPAVPIEQEVDALRSQENPSSRQLKVAWDRPASPLRIDDIDQLERTVRKRAAKRIFGPLGQGGTNPGQKEARW